MGQLPSGGTGGLSLFADPGGWTGGLSPGRYLRERERKHMKAMLVNEKKDMVWSEVPDPVIRPEEALVQIHAAALNRADLLQRQGKHSCTPQN